MNRARPCQHRRRLKSGRLVLVNRGIAKKRRHARYEFPDDYFDKPILKKAKQELAEIEEERNMLLSKMGEGDRMIAASIWSQTNPHEKPKNESDLLKEMNYELELLNEQRNKQLEYIASIKLDENIQKMLAPHRPAVSDDSDEPDEPEDSKVSDIPTEKLQARVRKIKEAPRLISVPVTRTERIRPSQQIRFKFGGEMLGKRLYK